MIVTERLEIVPATPELIRAALDGDSSLSSALGAGVPRNWPPEYLDKAALEFTFEKLVGVPEEAAWWMYFVILPNRSSSGRTLIGTVGFKGPPSEDGMVEVGYGIVSDFHRRGYASEATMGLVGHAFQVPTVKRVTAETLPALVPSIGVLRRCGFRFVGDGSEPGVIRYELTRAEYAEQRAH